MPPIGVTNLPSGLLTARADRAETREDTCRSPAGPPAAAGDVVQADDTSTSFREVRVHDPADVHVWRQRLADDPASAELFADLHGTDPEAARRLAAAIAAMPAVGTAFLGFRLLAELGRGALGRAYLATQGELADRHVVLKVSPEVSGETRALAQLQHTNVVPLYSVHHCGPLQAVCMPYFGATTLADILKGLRGREALPESGQGLISTLVDRASTVPGLPSSTPAVPTPAVPSRASSGEAPALRQGGSPVVREMLQRLSYVKAVLWMGSRLADGLAHAHEHGILHRDLKPANVLVTDEGQPMLLDFNLAEDTKLAGSAAAAQVGGTLPYMSPEQLKAYRFRMPAPLDFNSDVYSLGVMLYELLTGRHPFPSRSGPVHDVLAQMTEDRLRPPPRLRPFNRAVSPAVESIVRHCLEPDPGRRYRSAAELRNDLERQFDDLPLKFAPEPSLPERAAKWLRRHPRLKSTTTVAALAVAVILAGAGALVARGHRVAELEAKGTLARFLDDGNAAQLLLTARAEDTARFDGAVEACRSALAAYGVLDNPAWQESPAVRLLPEADRTRLREQAGELLVLLARAVSARAKAGDPGEAAAAYEVALRLNERAEACYGPGAATRAVWRQRAELAGLLGWGEEEKEYRARAEGAPGRGAADRYLEAADLVERGRFDEAAALLGENTDQDPRDFRSWFLLGVCHDRLARHADAVACYGTCVALEPDFPWAYYNRGLARLRLQDDRRAAADFGRALRLRPGLAEAFVGRAQARSNLGDHAGAVEDLTLALRHGADPAQAYLQRAAARARGGDPEGARKDRAEGLRLEPTDAQGWLARGYARLADDLEGAVGDFDRALRLDPRSLPALQNKAHALSRLGRNEESAAALDRAVEVAPESVKARAGRAVILARLGRREAAHRDVAECLARDGQPITVYQLAGVYALTSRTHPEDRVRAFGLLRQALAQGCGFDLMDRDKDLDPVRDCPEFRELVAAARAIRTGAANAAR